jgi:putative ABC transport system substrate-binding protein
MSLHRMLPVIAASLILFTSQAFGQQPAHRVGVLANMRLPETVQAWTEGLRERGYIEGQNLRVAYRYWQARTEQIPVLVSELLAFDPEIMVAATPQSAVAIHASASTIPMVFLNVADPVTLGLVASLAHPGVRGFRREAAPGS